LNPMTARKFSPEFIEMQKRNKIGVKNPPKSELLNPLIQ
jgi:hypothetical protein